MSSSNSSNKLGPYRLIRTLGIGSFSKVKLAVHEPTKKKVAIKILNRKKLSHMDMGQKIWREIKILGLFNHPHIIRLYEVIDTPTDIFMIMEYVPGGELFDYIVSKGRLPEAEARKYFQQIISGVEYCHTHMVAHRDLKPENLLLDDQSNVKLADFGLSNTMRDGFFLKTSCGSPNYAAPEVISGKLYAGPEVDVWSCGVILYALLCGSLPFDDDNIPNLFRKIKNGLYTLPSHLSEQARDLIPKMLVVDPMKRITLAEVKNHPFYIRDLPLYLALSPEDLISQSRTVDELSFQKVIAMGFSNEVVKQALASGPDLIISEKFPNQERLRPAAVAYNLILDEFRRTDPFAGTQFRQIIEEKRDSLCTAMTLLPYQLIGTGIELPLEERRLWSLGFLSKQDSQLVMNEVYRTCQVIGARWIVLNAYKIKLRHVFDDSVEIVGGDKQPKKASPKSVIKLGVQMYKMNDHEHMLDIQKLSGDLLHYLDFCGLFFQEFNPVFQEATIKQ